MKKPLLLIVLLFVCKTFAQNNSKTAFQKSRYELAMSYYDKADFKKAIDLFYFASKIKPESEIGVESVKKVDTLQHILREEILTQALGNWKMIGDKPIWAVNQTNDSVKTDVEEFVEIKHNEILFYEKSKKTQEKKLISSEPLVYYDGGETNSLFSDIILSDGTVWHCIINDKSDELRVINVGKKSDNNFEKITQDNVELFYSKVK